MTSEVTVMSERGRRLKILILPGWYPTKENPVSGVFVREQAQAVARYDDVVVLYAEPSSAPLRGLYELSDSREDGLRTVRVHYRRLPVPGTTTLLAGWVHLAGVRTLLRSGFRPDVIHAHVYYAGARAVLLGKLLGIPVVITEHSTEFPRRALTRRGYWEARFAMGRAQAVLPVSENLRDAIKAYGIRARFRVVPNVFRADLFYPADATSGQRNGHEPKRLLTVALLAEKKGISYLLEAVARLRRDRQDFRLDIVGDGEIRGRLEAQAAELGVADLVQFHGVKPKEEVARFMRQCDIFVLPSLVEPFGVVVIEALACGKPVVVTDSGGPGEIVNDSTGLVVPPGDAQALATALNDMLDRYPSYDPACIAAYAKERYGPDAIGQVLHDTYLTAVG